MVKLERQTFNQVVENLLRSRTQQARERVWDHIQAMPTLYFVQCGRQLCPVPWITFESDVPIAMVFTQYELAVQAAHSFIEGDREFRVVGLPTNAASMYLSALAAQGVVRVCFNHGPQRFDATIDEVLLVVNSMKR